ncbi:MAG TPA: hypothetical protein VM557_06555 [Thermoanaerobaculia bacterium]|nr:hypothetical protein [Thermoanaerobaculia bacterium]
MEMLTITAVVLLASAAGAGITAVLLRRLTLVMAVASRRNRRR